MSVANEERKALGLPVRTSDPMSGVTGDQELFKYALITPVEPYGIAEFEVEQQVVKEDGSTKVERQTIKRNVPRHVSTMALGNLNSKEVALARLYAELARVAAWNGYNNIAINYYIKWVDLNVTSQSHLSHLLDEVLSEMVQVTRKEESMTGTRDFNEEKGNKLEDFINKWKNKNSSEFTGQQAQQQSQHFGLR